MVFFVDITMTIQRLQGTFGAVDISYSTLTPLETPSYMNGLVRRAGKMDYRHTEGTVRFLPLQTEAHFNVIILDDTEPENDESIFVKLTVAQLITPAQVRPGKFFITNHTRTSVTR